MLLCTRGEILVCLISAASVASKKTIEELLEARRGEKGSMCMEGALLLQPQQGVYVPFGATALCFALMPRRPTNEEAEDTKSAIKVSNKKKADQDEGRKFGKLVWIPINSKTKDLENEAHIVSRVLRDQLRANEYLPSNVVKLNERHSWLEALAKKNAETDITDDHKSAQTKALQKNKSAD